MTEDVPIKDKQVFTPKFKFKQPATQSQINKYSGVGIKNLPKTLNRKDLVQFLFDNGLPNDTLEEDVVMGDHGNIDIKAVSYTHLTLPTKRIV